MILVVDDDAAHRMLLRELLESEGYRVVEAGDGAHALELLASGLRPQLLLTDLEMPRLDGRALLSAIARTGDPRLDLTVALVTGRPPEEVSDLSPVCAEILTKPIQVDQLLALVSKAVRRDALA